MCLGASVVSYVSRAVDDLDSKDGASGTKSVPRHEGNGGLCRDSTTRDTQTMAEGEADFRLFRELCDAFNDLGGSDLDDPITAKPFQYLHEDVELQDYPAIPGAAWH